MSVDNIHSNILCIQLFECYSINYAHARSCPVGGSGPLPVVGRSCPWAGAAHGQLLPMGSELICMANCPWAAPAHGQLLPMGSSCPWAAPAHGQLLPMGSELICMANCPWAAPAHCSGQLLPTAVGSSCPLQWAAPAHGQRAHLHGKLTMGSSCPLQWAAPAHCSGQLLPMGSSCPWAVSSFAWQIDHGQPMGSPLCCPWAAHGQQSGQLYVFFDWGSHLILQAAVFQLSVLLVESRRAFC